MPCSAILGVTVGIRFEKIVNENKDDTTVAQDVIDGTLEALQEADEIRDRT